MVDNMISLQEAKERVVKLCSTPIERRDLIQKCLDELNLSNEIKKDTRPGGILNKQTCQFGNAIHELIKSKVLKQDENKIIACVEQETNVEQIVTGIQRDEKIQNRILELLQSKPMTKKELFEDISILLKGYNLHQTAVRGDTGRILSVLVKDGEISLNNGTYEIKEKIDDDEENKKLLMQISDEELVYHTVLMLERYYKEKNSNCPITAKNTDGAGDNGIDGVITIEDDLGVDKIVLQVKNKQEKEKTIPQRQIKEFAGTLALNDAKHGIFITSAKYTTDTKKYAKEFSERVKRLDLIDGEKWLELAKIIGYSISKNKIN